MRLPIRFLALLGVILDCHALNLDSRCGRVSSRRLFQRIVGGSSARIEDVPYTVSLRKNDKHFCGGALIHKRYVLTAAHCVHSYEAKVWRVAVGEQNSERKGDELMNLEVEEITVHPDYVFPKFVNDIALLRLSKDVDWSDKAQPICLPQNGGSSEAKMAFLAGWGLDDESGRGGVPTQELFLAKLPLLSNEKCEKWFRSKGKRIRLRDSHLCAGHEQGGEDGCQGDSGGGLVALNKGKLELVGIMSAGIGCGREKLPGVYTRVEKFRNWIEQEIE